MKIVITSIASEEAGAILNDHLVFLAQALNKYFEGQSYGGLSQLTVLIVAVDSDAVENERVCAGNNKVGRFKHPVSGEQIRYLSFALPFDPSAVEAAPALHLREMIIDALISRLNNPVVNIPKNFQYENFAAGLLPRLEILKRIEIVEVKKNNPGQTKLPGTDPEVSPQI